ncbi:hypothetical protein G647_10213 [Cladophialophora carrionii CBS 160.54]|uniref:Uncharacterized protein n=1 Tax=Cladophialophora carrionii CBS 160.54 TaxID=1279043 RepID=V9DKB8_9EURO|nr:uncharacterized protein G647_10213 [Cladophialophora carrionii CBS 160.54]ETI26768.1 hypothetical protein G647_10213 [Cladophialophora carrionii CBS 160.54]
MLDEICHGISNKTLKTFLDKAPWAKVAEKASDTPQGQRLYPSRTSLNDANYNFRIDKGTNKDGKGRIDITGQQECE